MWQLYSTFTYWALPDASGSPGADNRSKTTVEYQIPRIQFFRIRLS